MKKANEEATFLKSCERGTDPGSAVRINEHKYNLSFARDKSERSKGFTNNLKYLVAEDNCKIEHCYRTQ